jgi:hypothetical protein
MNQINPQHLSQLSNILISQIKTFVDQKQIQIDHKNLTPTEAPKAQGA